MVQPQDVTQDQQSTKPSGAKRFVTVSVSALAGLAIGAGLTAATISATSHADDQQEPVEQASTDTASQMSFEDRLVYLGRGGVNPSELADQDQDDAEEDPQLVACTAALDQADELMDIYGDAMFVTSEGIMAAGSSDGERLGELIEDLESLTGNMEELYPDYADTSQQCRG